MPPETATASSTATTLAINLPRLKSDIRALSRIGRNPDDGGVYRMAFTDADMEARAWLLDRIRDAGLEASQDGAGNISGVLPGRDGDAPRIVVGSHIDTVPCAGTLDGALGVLVGLECLRRLREDDFEPLVPLELVAFTDEEGRFGGMFGSQAFAGMVNPETLLERVDVNGLRLADAMKSHGMDPWQALDARRRAGSVAAYLELHIEQGPVLDRAGDHVGVVEGITGLFRWTVTLIGESNHAGTTPMDHRRDAFSGLAEFIRELPRILGEHGSTASTGTVGNVALQPGSPNTVPGVATFSLDVRDPTPEVLESLATATRETLSAIGRDRGLMFEFTIDSEIAPVACDDTLIDLLAGEAARLEIPHRRMPSGAAHDAQIIATVAPVGMIFVPSREGRSHSPAEWTAWAHVEAGANVMLGAVAKLAQRQVPGQAD